LKRLSLTTLMTCICFFCLCMTSFSNAAEATPTPSKKPADMDKSENWFNKLGVGGAIGWTHNLGRSRVEEASVVDGVVRVDAKQNDSVRPWVEVHAWFNEWGGTTARPRWGLGPFVAVAPGSNFVDAVAMGVMLGRKYKTEGNSNLSFNLAIGGALELNAKVLGDGVTANQPPPGSETSARTKTTSLGSLLVMFSVGWDAFASTSTDPEDETPKVTYEPEGQQMPVSFTVSEPMSIAEKKAMIGPQKPS